MASTAATTGCGKAVARFRISSSHPSILPQSGPLSAERVRRCSAAALREIASKSDGELSPAARARSISSATVVRSLGRPAAMAASYLAAKRGIVRGNGHIGLVIDPLMTGQFLIGGSREDHRSDHSTDAVTIAAILREALDLYPPLAHRRVLRSFAGVRTASRDGLPIVGPHPQRAGMVIATGFEGDGICLGPYMGASAARLLLGEKPEVDLSALSPQRFVHSEAHA